MYRTIDTAFWTDPAVRKLPAPAKMLFLYLITNSHAHVGGIYYLPAVTVCHETGIKPEILDTLYDTLSRPKTEQDEVGLILRDRDSETIWVVNMLRYQGKGEKILRSVAAHLKTLHKSPLIKNFVESYPAVKRYFKDRVSDTPSRTSPKLARVGIQEQEQELNTKTPYGVLSAVADAGRVPCEGDETEESKPGMADKPNRTRKQASGDHHELIRCFCDGWKVRYQVAYKFVEGKDGKHIKWLLNAVVHDGEEAKRIVRAYFADDDPFVIEKRHPLGLLISSFNKYRAIPPAGETGPPHARQTWQEIEAAKFDKALDAAFAEDET